jgi:hypothetical protein
MLLYYHDEILTTSFDNEDNYFKELKSFDYITKDLLKHGLHYPDIPCSDIVYTNNNKIKYYNYKACITPFTLIYAYLLDKMEHGLKEIVQNHTGREVIAHSMSYDPNLSVFEIRQEILRKLEILYMLAINDTSLIKKCNDKECVRCYESMFDTYECIKPEPNIFWLGQILHCVQDSYSRVHTLREFTNTNINGGHIPETETETETETKILKFKLIKIINEKLDKIDLENIKIDSNSNEDIQKYLKTIIDAEYHEIIDNNPWNISHMFKLILFFKNQRKTINELFIDKNNLPSEINKSNNTSSYENYPYIMSFRYFPHQEKCGIMFHMYYDTKEKTEETGFQTFMIDNCKYILDLYKEHVLKLKAGDIDIKDCINEMITYIAKNVFPILDKYKDKNSAIKCNPHPCECKIELDEVYDLYNQPSDKTGKQISDQTGGYYKKYLKYKLKYLELKSSI